MKEWLSGHYRAANKKYQALLAKEKACYFADDLFGLLLQLGRDVVCYGYLIGQLMQGMSIARFVLYIGIVSGFSTYFSELTMMISQISSLSLIHIWKRSVTTTKVISIKYLRNGTSLRRHSSAKRCNYFFRFILQIPFPVSYLRQILTVLVDVLFVLYEFVVHLLYQIRSSVSKLWQLFDDVLY